MSPRRLRPEEDRLVADLGYALTDLVGHWDPRWVEIDALVAKVERWSPDWLAFTSKGVAQEAGRALGRRGRVIVHVNGELDWHRLCLSKSVNAEAGDEVRRLVIAIVARTHGAGAQSEEY